jgi:hypothetical protein
LQNVVHTDQKVRSTPSPKDITNALVGLVVGHIKAIIGDIIALGTK